MKTKSPDANFNVVRCGHCPGRTPLRADPTSIQRAKELCFEPPLDEGIREIVLVLAANGVETFESCEGGEGHSFPWPTVRFEGGGSEGLRALSVALENGLPVDQLRRAWGVIDGLIHGPWWEMTFLPPRDSPLWIARYTAPRYAVQKANAQRAANMTDEQRSESARRAVQARWAKVKSDEQDQGNSRA